MFINRTNIAGLSPMMTKEIILTLNEYSGLRVYGGDHQAADAVLVGVLESEDLKNKTFKTTETVFTDKKLQESIEPLIEELEKFLNKTSNSSRVRIISF